MNAPHTMKATSETCRARARSRAQSSSPRPRAAPETRCKMNSVYSARDRNSAKPK